MTDPRKIAEDIEAGGGATVEQRRTLARAYLEMVRDLPHAVGRCRCVLTVIADRERHDAAVDRLAKAEGT